MTVSETRTECPRCGSTSPSRALGGCFHSWHADPELLAEPSRGAPDARTSKDYAIEFGGYLADAVEHYLQVRNLFDGKQATIGCDVADQDLLNDHRRALENGVGEFRKRAARVEPETGHVVLLEALRAAQKTIGDIVELGEVTLCSEAGREITIQALREISAKNAAAIKQAG